MIPVGFARLSGGIQSAFTHGLMGYRNFDIKDKSTNHTLCNYITFGEGLHNNHHKYPGKVQLCFSSSRNRSNWMDYRKVMEKIMNDSDDFEGVPI